MKMNIRSVLLLFSSLAITAATFAQDKENFKFEDHSCFLIKPAQPLEGNPWVWRAYFPTWHTSIDSALVSEGYHIAYINTSDMYGAPEAINIWDRFYSYLVNERGLSHQVVLEGVSRGGLYIHNWAKRNATKVACIYAEAPVCNIASWPYKKSDADWQKLLKVYRFDSDEEALAYTDNPLDGLDGLAAMGVPIMHTVSNTDQIVPPSDNSYQMAKRYTAAGGSMAIVPMKRFFNVKEQKGHHFHIDNTNQIVAFIKSNSYPVKAMLKSTHYHIDHATKAFNFATKFNTEKKGNVAFLGGSITHNDGWRNLMTKYLKELYPETEIDFLAAGIPSLGSIPHSFRFKQDVLDKMIPDLLFIEAAVNDRGNQYAFSDQTMALEGIIRQARRSNPKMDIIMMHFADPDKIADYKQGISPKEIETHNDVAKRYHIPVIDISREIYDRIENGEFTWKDDIIDLHPSRYGQEVYFNSMKTLIDTLLTNTNKGATVDRYVEPTCKRSFDNGRYGRIQEAKLAKGSSSFVYHERYTPTNGQSGRASFVNVPMLVAEQPGAELSYEFKGNTIGLCVISGNDAGTIEYSIDGSAYKQLDLFTQWSKALHLPWYLILDSNLKHGKHKIKIRTTTEKNNLSKGNACRIVHFLVN